MPDIPTEEAQELLKEFGILFLKNYGATVFEKIKAELAASDEEDNFKLKYRPAAEEKRSDLFAGECYYKKGEGPGSFSGWKKGFVAERDDSNIDIFPDEKAYKGKKKPTATVPTAGYKVITDVSSYYADSMRSLAGGLGLTEQEVTAMTTFSRYSWALAHPQRTNYVFQLHKGKNPPCPCFGGGAAVDPDESGAENRDEIINYVNALKRCVGRANQACNKSKETSRIAFRKACEQIPSKIESLHDWSDNGTEGEMLVDLLMEALLPPMRDQMFDELKGPASMKLTMWYKSVGLIQKSMLAIVEPAWNELQKGAAKLEGKVEDAVRPAIAKILEIKKSVEDKINEKVGSKVGSALGNYVTPFIKPIIDIFEVPMKRGFVCGREVLASRIDVQTLSQDKPTRDAYLGGLATSPAQSADIRHAASDLVAPLQALTQLSDEVFGDLNPSELKDEAEDMMIKTVDAAAYTVALRLDNGEAANDQLIQQLLADYDHDAIVMRCEFVKEVARRLLIGSFKKLTSPVTKPVIDTVNDAIPEEMKDFLNIENILDNLIDTLVGTPIDKVVMAAYPLP